ISDGTGALTLFTTDTTGNGGNLFADFIKPSGEVGVGFPFNPGVTSRIESIPGSGEIADFQFQVRLDGPSDTIALLSSNGNVIASGNISDAIEMIDPANGLNLFIGNDQTNETAYFAELSYEMKVERLIDSGTLAFTDVDVSDVHSVSITDVSIVGDANGLTAAQAEALVSLAVNSTTTAAAGAVDWAFSAADADFAYLAVNETLVLSYEVTVEDDKGGSDSQTLTVRITGVNEAPVGAPAAAFGDEDTDITGVLIATDVDGDALTFELNSRPANGAVIIEEDGSYTYTPNADFNGTDSFTYLVSDGNGGEDVKTATITVNPINDAPVVAAALAAAAAEDDAAFTVDLLAGASDVDVGETATLSVQNVSGLVDGVTLSGTTLSVDPADASFQSLAVGDAREIEVTYQVVDAQGATVDQSASITITGTNDAPVVQALTGAIDENAATQAFDAPVNDSFIAGNAGRFYVFDLDTGTSATVARGGATVTTVQALNTLASADNALVIQVNPNNDGWALSVELVVDGVISGISPDDLIVTDLDGGAIDRSGALFIGFADSNELVNAVRIELNNVALSDGRVLDIQAQVNDLDYEVNATDDVRIDNVQFTAQVRDTADQVTVTAAFTDVDATDTHSYSVDTTGTLGAVTNNGDGTFTYAANGAFENLAEGQIATDTFTYTVTDNNGGANTETVTITVTGTNDAPVVAAPLTAAAAEDDAGFTVDLLDGASDVDAGETATLSVQNVSALPDGVTLSGTTLSVDPSDASFQSLAVSETRELAVSYQVVDAQDATVDQTATITITGTNDAPVVAAALTAAADEDDASFTVDLLAGASDVDAGETATLSVQNVSALPDGVTLSGTALSVDPADASFQSLAVNETREIAVTYQVVDAQGATVDQSATITITGANDAPVIDVAGSDLVEQVGAGYAVSGSFDAEDFLDAFDPARGTATLQTVNGLEAMRVQVNDDNVRNPHTFLDIVDAGALDADDRVSITIDGQVTRTGSDQDIFFGVTDGVGQVSYFGVNGRAGRLYNGELKTNALPSDTLQDGAVEFNLLDLSGPQLNSFSLEVVLDGQDDTISVFTSSGSLIGTFDGFNAGSPTPDQTNAIDPTRGLDLFLASDGANETNFFVSLDYEMQITRQGTIAFTDVDISDVHTVQIDEVRFVGNANGLTDAEARDLMTFSINSTAALAEGSVDWAFTISDFDAVYLAEGETFAVEYDVTVLDGNDGSDDETVQITFTGVNDAPTALNDVNAGAALVEQGYGVAGNGTATGNLLDNDSDPDTTDVLRVTNVDAGTGEVGSNMPVTTPAEQIVLGKFGSLNIAATGAWTYTLNNADADTEALEDGVTGTEIFAYNVSDGNGGTAEATLTLEIAGSDDNAAPVAVDDAITLDEDTSATLDLLGNDTDANNVSTVTQVLTLVSINGIAAVEGAVIATTNGSITIGAGGSVDYTPDENFNGADSFGYVITDGLETSDAGTANLTIASVNDVPVITAGGTAAYVENATGVAVGAGLTLADLDDTSLEGATVAITGGFDATQDSLSFIDQNGISGSYDALTGVLTLSGTATLAQYQTAMTGVTYANS
uniref:beta strand repeat-containing protein n=1 Tax=Sulfitobacter sp. TaxID=1903071 RepID=UPI00356278DE